MSTSPGDRLAVLLEFQEGCWRWWQRLESGRSHVARNFLARCYRAPLWVIQCRNMRNMAIWTTSAEAGRLGAKRAQVGREKLSAGY